jgi:hypothetical protein
MYWDNRGKCGAGWPLQKKHSPYSQALLSAILTPDLNWGQTQNHFHGEVTSPITRKPNAVLLRAAYTLGRMLREHPELWDLAADTLLRCHKAKSLEEYAGQAGKAWSQ